MEMRIAHFEKVSYEEFEKEFLAFAKSNLQISERFGVAGKIAKMWYDKIKLPKRATTGSAGYDLFIPFALRLKPGETVKIPTGIRCKIDNGWVLKLYPRSGLGFKYRLRLNNTVGIIDSDYYNSDNEGHIMVKITNETNENKILSLEAGDGFVQGIFLPFGLTVDDDADGIRNGGFGSTKA